MTAFRHGQQDGRKNDDSCLVSCVASIGRTLLFPAIV
jgi:hypothetical protein